MLVWVIGGIGENAADENADRDDKNALDCGMKADEHLDANKRLVVNNAREKFMLV